MKIAGRPLHLPGSMGIATSPDVRRSPPLYPSVPGRLNLLKPRRVPHEKGLKAFQTRHVVGGRAFGTPPT